MKELYTAVGRFEKRKGGHDKQHPVVLNGRKEHIPDIHEMMIWSTLNWRILSRSQLERLYVKRLLEAGVPTEKSFADYLGRLLNCGLIVKGSGETDADAFYDLFAGLYILPINRNVFTNTAFFLKLTLLQGVPFTVANREVFGKDAYTADERLVLKLTRQSLITTAELMKCVEEGATDISDDDKLTDALFTDDHTTSTTLLTDAKDFDCMEPILTAVANLYLRKQIIFTTEG